MLERHEELVIEETEALLARTSQSTMERRLREAPRPYPWPSASIIQMELSSQEEHPNEDVWPKAERGPSFFETDLAAQCGRSLRGQFIYALDLAYVALMSRVVRPCYVCSP